MSEIFENRNLDNFIKTIPISTLVANEIFL